MLVKYRSSIGGNVFGDFAATLVNKWFERNTRASTNFIIVISLVNVTGVVVVVVCVVVVAVVLSFTCGCFKGALAYNFVAVVVGNFVVGFCCCCFYSFEVFGY